MAIPWEAKLYDFAFNLSDSYTKPETVAIAFQVTRYQGIDSLLNCDFGFEIGSYSFSYAQNSSLFEFSTSPSRIEGVFFLDTSLLGSSASIFGWVTDSWGSLSVSDTYNFALILNPLTARFLQGGLESLLNVLQFEGALGENLSILPFVLSDLEGVLLPRLASLSNVESLVFQTDGSGYLILGLQGDFPSTLSALDSYGYLALTLSANIGVLLSVLQSEGYLTLFSESPLETLLPHITGNGLLDLIALSDLHQIPSSQDGGGVLQAVFTQYYELFITGQSLAEGTFGTPLASISQPYSNKMLSQGVRAGGSGFTSLAPLVEQISIDGIDAETIASGTANALSETHGSAWIAHVSALGGTAYSGLKKGTTPYTEALAQINAVKSLSPLPVNTTVLALLHGEQAMSDSSLTYLVDLKQWKADYKADIRAIYADFRALQTFLYQVSSWQWYRRQTSPIPKNQLRFATDDPEVSLVCPTYFFKFNTDLIKANGQPDYQHLTDGAEYRRLGEYYAKAIKAQLFGGGWQPLRPVTCNLAGNLITVKFLVPVPPLVFDITSVLSKTNMGFEYTDSAASASIVSVAIISATEVRLTLSNAPTGINPKVAYAWTSGVPGSGTLTDSHVPRGNLRDSDPALGKSGDRHPSGSPLFNWCVHFQLDVIETRSNIDSLIPYMSGEALLQLLSSSDSEAILGAIDGSIVSNDASKISGGSEVVLTGFDSQATLDLVGTGDLMTVFANSDGAFVDPIDPVVSAWMANVTSNGGTYDTTTRNALDTLVKAWKANGTWDLMLQFNPCCGEDSKAGQVKVRYPSGTSQLETLNNHSASTYTKTNGWQGIKSTSSGTVRYLKTGFDPFVQSATPLDFGMHFATTQAKTTGTTSVWIMGNRNSQPDFNDGTNTVIYETGGNEVRGVMNQANGVDLEARYTTAIAAGLISAQFDTGETVPTDNRSRLFLNGSLVATAVTNPGVDRAFREGEIYVQSRNLMYNAAIQQSSNRNCIGYMLTKRIKNFSNLVTPWNTFKAAIGR